MAAGDTDIGTGTILTFANFTAELLSLSWSGIERPAIDTSHMGSANNVRTFIPGDLYDPGEIAAEVHLNTTEAPPITAAPTTLTIAFAADTNDTWSCSAFLTGFEFTDPLEDKMMATATFKATGVITF